MEISGGGVGRLRERVPGQEEREGKVRNVRECKGGKCAKVSCYRWETWERQDEKETHSTLQDERSTTTRKTLDYMAVMALGLPRSCSLSFKIRQYSKFGGRSQLRYGNEGSWQGDQGKVRGYSTSATNLSRTVWCESQDKFVDYTDSLYRIIN